MGVKRSSSVTSARADVEDLDIPQAARDVLDAAQPSARTKTTRRVLDIAKYGHAKGMSAAVIAKAIFASEGVRFSHSAITLWIREGKL